MKKTRAFLLLSGLCAALAGCQSAQSDAAPGPRLWSVLLIVLSLVILALAALRTNSIIQYNKRRARSGRRRRPRTLDPMTLCMYALSVLLLLFALMGSCSAPESDADTTDRTAGDTVEGTETPVSTGPGPEQYFHPVAAESANPDNWNIRWEIIENGTITHSYQREETILFGDPDHYFALPGIATFRGNNHRTSPSYGTAEVTEEEISVAWSVDSTSIAGGVWEGSGWTGQPLIVKWDEATKSIMNLYANKKSKVDLVEVIYATLDGHIYFLDLEDGSYTRDPINMGMCFKGAGSLDPRGYPLMYVGSGDEDWEGKRPRFFIISLIDGKVLFEYGHDEAMVYRKDNEGWCAFDSSPLVDAETDTLVWPGENGLLYTFKLNTNYDKAAGTISIKPDAPVSTRYITGRSNFDSYWLGYEASASVVGGYLYVSENGGMFYCVDLNTMELVWAQDTRDDSNSSPVFEWVSENEGYIYTAPSLHWTKNSDFKGPISIFKLNALTGEILWESSYNVSTVSGISGGVQSTPLLGKEGTSIEGLIIYTVARTPRNDAGVMVALDTETGEPVWTWWMDYYTWSSPVPIYTDDGKAYIVVCDAAGYATLLDGKTGKILSSEKLTGLVEASPAAYGNTLIVGTRGKKIYGLEVN